MSLSTRSLRPASLPNTLSRWSSSRSSSFSAASAQRNVTVRRTMATKPAPTKEFLCILPDKPNVVELRKSVRGEHYKGIQPLIASGKLVAGGAMFERHPVDNEPALFKGSMIIYTGETVEQVRSLLSQDVYATSGVWDLDAAKIIPYVSAVREPLK